MKLKIIALAAAACALPAFAQETPSDTLQSLISKGASMSVAQMGITGDINYKADGTFSGFDGQYEGTYKVNGTKLCTTAAAVGEDNACIEYPTGKKSGDKFTIKHPTVGDIEVTLK